MITRWQLDPPYEVPKKQAEDINTFYKKYWSEACKGCGDRPGPYCNSLRHFKDEEGLKFAYCAEHWYCVFYCAQHQCLHHRCDEPNRTKRAM